jgi:hypothetical protein
VYTECTSYSPSFTFSPSPPPLHGTSPVCVYYTLIWFISSIFFSLYLSPFLMVISTDLKILYLFLYREFINYIHLNFLLLLSPSPR